MEFVKRLFRPFLWARYSLFLKNNRRGTPFDVKEEYSMLTFSSTMSAVWPELAALLILSRFTPIAYETRLYIMAVLTIANYIISRIIVSGLKRDDYVENLMNRFPSEDSGSKYGSTLYCLGILTVYAVIPMLTIVIYFLIVQ